MNSKHNAPTTTTEELIVQYLDGELIRKELETVLFDRLSRSEEARMLLREYLVVRGAIRVSRNDKRIQLSDDLDERTRARIVQIMEAMTAEELQVPAIAIAKPLAKRGFKADHGAIASLPMSRQVKRWQLRGSIAALSLLLAFGTVWLVTGSTGNHNMAGLQLAQKPTLNSITAPIAQTQPTQEAGSPITGEPVSMTKKRSAAHLRTSGNASSASPAQFVSNGAQSHEPKADEPASPAETSDPSAIMITHRYTKAIDASKNEVVVSGKDRL
jgi:negative regulator of sigma E activity